MVANQTPQSLERRNQARNTRVYLHPEKPHGGDPPVEQSIPGRGNPRQVFPIQAQDIRRNRASIQFLG